MNSILDTRKTIQLKRKIMDSNLMHGGSLFVYESYISSKLLKIGLNILNYFLNGYWHFVKRFV